MSITDFMPFLLRIAASVIVKDAKSAYIRSPFCLAKIDDLTDFKRSMILTSETDVVTAASVAAEELV